ncbi:MAG: class D sortase [Bryobacteraceae bacterium]|jgi:sortase A
MRVAIKGALWRIAESTFLIAGLALLDCYIWSQARVVLYQTYASREFRSELRQLPEGKAPAPSGVLPLHRGDELVGRLEIPRLGMRVMVREGDDEATLAKAVGHLPSSALPGARGNVALAGHRDTFFRPLREIRISDRIVFATLHGTFEYRVEALSIVGPGDVSVLQASAEPTLTLVTCYPFHYIGSAPQRFIVRARQTVPAMPGPATQGAALARSSPGQGWSRSPGFSASAARRRHRRS